MLAWVGVLLRDHGVSEAASPLLFEAKLSAAEFDRNIAKLEDAELLNPDSSLQLARATYLLVASAGTRRRTPPRSCWRASRTT